LLLENKYFTLFDVERDFKRSEGKASHVKILHEQGIQSAIFEPIANENG
jgi:hypothetical protein